MAAAYATLVSLAHIIEQITHHAPPQIQLLKNMFKTLSENVKFLQDFLEEYSHIGCKETELLETQIVDAAYAAEDIIETHIVDQIHDMPTDFILFCGGIHKVNQDMGLIKKEALIIKEKRGIEKPQVLIPVSSLKPLPVPHVMNNKFVGLDAAVIEVLDRITGYQTNRLILPIVGMGGIGKTTLAKSVFDHPVIVQNFDVSAWVTVSQKYSVREIILGLLSCQGNSSDGDQKSDDELGQKLYKSLWGRRYLIVLDDMWSIEAWDKVKFYFPYNNNGSRILVTTRLRNVAIHFGSDSYEIGFLDEEKSWNLFCGEVFGQEDCPFELEEIGRKIANKCKGLPLSIVVVGGLLAKSEKTREYWEYVVENLNSIVNLEDDEHCLKILSLSYHQLPIHLKPCFLYMGVFPEDYEIRVSSLIKLWVAERFVKPISSKSLEIVAEEYLMDLIDRNLILVHKFGSLGKVKFCKLHDLLRDVCLREGKKERGLCATSVYSVDNLQGMRRICIHRSTSSNDEFSVDQVHHSPQSAQMVRSLMCDFYGIFPFFPFRLLRVFNKDSYSTRRITGNLYSLEAVFQFVNLRYLAFGGVSNSISMFPSSICRLWNLQTLIVTIAGGETIVLPPEIWEMRQLRHLQVEYLFLPDPLSGSQDCVLKNLQMLQIIQNFKCSEEVVKRIPNIKKLKFFYDDFRKHDCYSLQNLHLLCQLESLSCLFLSIHTNDSLHDIAFPHSLKKLTLGGNRLPWQDMTLIGSLPNLQVLKLEWNAFVGPEWITSEGEFRRLRRLKISDCYDLESWIADSTHFPCLEKLNLRELKHLEEIPLDFGEIPTLASIELVHCSHSAVVSAKKILEEQENAGNEGLIQVKVYLDSSERESELRSLESKNFRIHVYSNLVF